MAKSRDSFEKFSAVAGGYGEVDDVKIGFCFEACFGDGRGDARAIVDRCGGGAEKDILPVPYVPYGWQAEAEHTTLLNFRRFRKAIGYLIEDIQKGDRNGNTDGTAV